MGGRIEIEQVELLENRFIIQLRTEDHDFEVMMKMGSTTVSVENGSFRSVVGRSYIFQNGEGIKLDAERFMYWLLHFAPFKELGLTPVEVVNLTREIINKIVQAKHEKIYHE